VAYFLIPAVAPQLLTGMRAGLSMGWMSVIAAEMVCGQSGLGYSIQLYRQNLQYDLMTMDMVAIGAIGFFLHESMVRLDKRLMPWHHRRLS
jgi:ABC-type nitrate/sulfonate/bicarbonate transport system permease component